jgi:hypothetical protein
MHISFNVSSVQVANATLEAQYMIEELFEKENRTSLYRRERKNQFGKG